MRDDDLHAHLRDAARTLEARSRPAVPDEVIDRPAPHVPSRRRTAALAAAGALAVLGGVALWQTAGEDPERLDIVTPAPDPEPDTTTTTAPTTTQAPPTTEPVVPPGGPDLEDLPPGGIVVTDGEQPGVGTLFDLDGRTVTEIRSPEISRVGTSAGPPVLAIGPGDPISLGLLPPDGAEAPDGCTGAAGRGGVRVALCGGDPQLPTTVVRVTPWGGLSTLLGPLHTDPVSDEPSGHWRWALPSPDGAWVIGQWSGACEVPTAILLSTAEDAPRAIDGGALDTTVDSRALGWTDDGKAIVHFGPGACGSGVTDPGVYLVDPVTLERTLVVPLPRSSAAAWLWKLDPGTANPLERSFARATSELGLEGCCGEPSHGGDGLTAGVVWMGPEIPVGASPSVEPVHVPFNDLVISSEPIDLGGLPATAGDADLGPFVAFTCGEHTWAVGVAGLGERATPEQVRSLAERLIPHLYCTVGERPRATGHGPGAAEPRALLEIADTSWGCGPGDGRTLDVTLRMRGDEEADVVVQLVAAGRTVADSGTVHLGEGRTNVTLEVAFDDESYSSGIGDLIVRADDDAERFLAAGRLPWQEGSFPACG